MDTTITTIWIVSVVTKLTVKDNIIDSIENPTSGNSNAESPKAVAVLLRAGIFRFTYHMIHY